MAYAVSSVSGLTLHYPGNTRRLMQYFILKEDMNGMKRDLTKGNVTKTMLWFVGPVIAGNMLQQFYHLADTWIVGRYLGSDALGAVGSAYTLMTFLTSILIGLCMGSGSVCSFYFGKKDEKQMKQSMQISFLLIGSITIILNLLVLLFLNPILRLLRIPNELMGMMRDYTQIVFLGMFFVFLYNYFAFLLRAVGNSIMPLFFLGGTALLNVILDVIFVVKVPWGISGAAIATVIAQGVSGIEIAIYTWVKEPRFRFQRTGARFDRHSVMEIFRFSVAAVFGESGGPYQSDGFWRMEQEFYI